MEHEVPWGERHHTRHTYVCMCVLRIDNTVHDAADSLSTARSLTGLSALSSDNGKDKCFALRMRHLLSGDHRRWRVIATLFSATQLKLWKCVNKRLETKENEGQARNNATIVYSMCENENFQIDSAQKSSYLVNPHSLDDSRDRGSWLGKFLFQNLTRKC